MDLNSVSIHWHQKKNLVNIQPSWRHAWSITHIYYMEESVLLGIKPLLDSIRHFIQEPSGVFSVCHLCESRIVQWRYDSRLLLLLNWFLQSYNKKITRWLEDMNFKFSWQDSNIKFISSHHRVISSIILLYGGECFTGN